MQFSKYLDVHLTFINMAMISSNAPRETRIIDVVVSHLPTCFMTPPQTTPSKLAEKELTSAAHYDIDATCDCIYVQYHHSSGNLPGRHIY